MSERTKLKQAARVLELDQVSNINAPFAALNRKFDNLEMTSMSGAHSTKSYDYDLVFL